MIILYLLSLVTVLSDTPDSLVIKYSAEYNKDKIGDKLRYNLKDGGVFPEEKGYPALASVKKSILIPVDGKVELKYQVLSSRSEKAIPTMIQFYGEKQPSENPKSYTPLPVTISGNNPSPHGNATLTINPFSFDGRKVTVRNSILIKIYFRGGEWIRPRGYQRRISQIFLNKIRGEQIRTSAIRGLRQESFLYAKIKTIKEGLYEITPGDLNGTGIDPLSIDPEEIEVLGGYHKIMKWSMDSMAVMDTLPDVLPAIYESDGDGVFEEGERIIFYSHSLSGWDRNKFTENSFFYYHPYTDTNVYWLRFSGDNPLEMEQISQAGGEQITHFTDTIHLEEDVYSPLKSGLAWGWEELNTTGGTSDNYLQTSFNILNNYNNRSIIRVAFYPKTPGDYSINVSLNGQSVLKTIASQGAENRERTVVNDTINTLNSGSNELVVTLETPDESIIMDYVEIIYERRLVANENKLLIANDQAQMRNYSASGFLNDPYVLNISDSREPFLISHSFSNNNANFSTNSGKILLQSFPYTIENISLADPTNLLQGGADWILITDNQFISPATSLKNWRENHLRGISSPSTRVIKIDDIYNNFSYGVKDPSAIKRFLYWTQENWNPPVSYVLLFGDGSYDDKNLTGSNEKTSFIPIHTKGTTIYTTSSYLTSNPSLDSWYVDFNEEGNVAPDIPIGRVTVSNISEGIEWVNKLMDYEKSTGDWRAKAILMADDAFAPPTTCNTEKAHTEYMENLSEFLPDWLYRDKIYLMEYPWGPSGNKPSAKQAHLEAMNDGALLGIYLGHGNLTKIAHESVFEIQDVNALSNWRKTPFYYFGSCDVGYFERPDEDCIGSSLNLYKNGGNIVSIAAGRSSDYFTNSTLGRRLIQNLFNDSVKTGGDVFLLAKEAGGEKTYTYFGDPATSILFDSVPLNITLPDTALGGDRLEIKGDVANSADKIFCVITEASYDTILDASEGTEDFIAVPITKEGKTLFRGSAPVISDSFTVEINIPYDIESDSGNIRIYSKGEKESYNSSLIYFTEGSLPEDSIPPSVEFRIENRVIERGDLIPPKGEIILVVRDSSGIDLRKKTNIQVIVNDINEYFLADRFSYITGSSTTGEVAFSYDVPALNDSLKFKVFARDNAGNITISEISFRIGEEELLWNVNNYPNPMKDKTVIVYHLSEEVSVEIKIFTIAGRLVEELQPGVTRYGANYVEWNGRDRKGRKVSNGIYYYSIKAGDAKPYYGKIAVIR